MQALGLASVWAASAYGQDSRPPKLIACLFTATESAYRHLFAEFRRGLKELGYVEGRDFLLDVQWGDEKPERLQTMIAEALRQNPAVLVTAGSPAVANLQKATSTVPIVFASAGDPVGQGFVKSFRRPGGNITGVAFNDEINKKLYELVRNVLPAATRIATVINPANPAMKHHLEAVPAVSKSFKFESILIEARHPEAFEPAYVQAKKLRAHALICPPLSPYTSYRERFVELQNRYMLPTFFGYSEPVSVGGLASYSFPLEDSYRRSAALVVEILKGSNPAEIPVEIPTKYEIWLNLKTAKALGIEVPQAVLLSASRVIK